MTEATVSSARLSEGHEFEPFMRESGFEYWNRYAAVNDEFIPIHMYDSAGQAAGYPTAFGMGNLTWAYMHIAIHQWLGDDCVISRLSTQFRSAVVRGTKVHVMGRVSEVRQEGDGVIVELELRAQDGEGKVLAPATATVRVPR